MQRSGDHRQHTIASPATCVGVGVHRGERVVLTLKPGLPDTGVVFVRTDLTGRPEIAITDVDPHAPPFRTASSCYGVRP